MRVRDDGVLNQVGSDACGKKWLDCGCILKVEPIDFAGGFDMEYEGVRGVKMTKDFGLSY